MAKTTAEKPSGPTQSLTTDFVPVINSLPLVGPTISNFLKMSSKGKSIVLLVVFLLVVYPLVSLFAALLIISKSPSSVQKSARNFILNAVGVDEQMMDRVNRSNLVIDASIPLQLRFGENEQAVQRVAAGQRITFEAFMRRVHVDGPDCAVEQPVPDEAIGRITVRSLGSNADAWTENIEPTFGQLFTVGTLDDRQWQKFQASTKSGQPEPQHLLKIKLTENPEVAGSPFLKCNKIAVDLYMNIFKPPLVRAVQ